MTAFYSQVSEKLHAVEVEANDPEIQAIRANLDGLLSLAQRSAAKASKLKSSFVKVYLVRG